VLAGAGYAYQEGGGDSPSQELFSYLGQSGGDPHVVGNLINQGANVNFRDSRTGETPLHKAIVHRQHIDIVKLLLDRGALVNAADNGKRTPLHEAVSYYSPDTAALLIEKGADVNRKDAKGRPTLYNIVFSDAKKSSVELTKLFIRKGFAVKELVDAKFLNEAISRGRGEIALIFLTNGAGFNDESLLAATRVGNKEIFSLLLDKGANSKQSSLLDVACVSGNIAIARRLVENNVAPSAEVIDRCLFNGHKEMAVYLNGLLKKEKNQEVDIKARCRMTPDGGICMAAFNRAYFNPISNACFEFIYGGCGGVAPFNSLEACKRVCVE
jgi:hypothetical protein